MRRLGRRMVTGVNRVLRPTGWALVRRARSPQRFFTDHTLSDRGHPHVIVIGTRDHSLSGPYKLTEHWYLPAFRDALLERDIKLIACSSRREFARYIPPHEEAVVVLIYNEEHGLNAEIRATQELCVRRIRKLLLVHSVEVGAVIGNKTSANQFLSSRGVPMPRLVALDYQGQVFSNAQRGSKKEVIFGAIQNCPPSRYNTVFIDTRHEYKGEVYYVALRANAVGKRLISVYVRARPVADGNPSVHAEDTPLDPELLSYLYNTIVVPHYSRIEAITNTAGEALGLGFFAHDILFDRLSKRFFLCETSFKFDNNVLRSHLWPIRNRVSGLFDPFSGVEVKAAAAAFVEQARERGFLVSASSTQRAEHAV